MKERNKADRAASPATSNSSGSIPSSPTSCNSGKINSKLSCKNGQNPATEALERVTQCAAMARGPTAEVKSRKLVFFRHTDKEDLIQELQTLKGAVLDQTYHFQLHKIQLVSLRDQHNALEKTVADLESFGAEAPRTGGTSRLSAKILGLQTKMHNLELDLQVQYHNLKKLKYKYQVCATQEARLQREACAGDVLRLQKAKRHGDRLLSRLTKENNRFLDLRDRIIPSLQKEIEGYNDFIKDAKIRIKDAEEGTKIFVAQQDEKIYLTEQRVKQIQEYEDKAKKLRGQLNHERERKCKMQQELWVLDAESRYLAKDNRMEAKLKAARQ